MTVQSPDGRTIATAADAIAARHRRISPRATAHRQHGYSLIEVIVAFALLALALTLLLGTLSGAARQVRWASDAGRAALQAQSLLDQVGVGAPITPGQRDGEFDQGRTHWTLAVTPWSDPAAAAANAPVDPAAARLYELALSVQWGDRDSQKLRVRTLRLATPDIEASLP